MAAECSPRSLSQYVATRSDTDTFKDGQHQPWFTDATWDGPHVVPANELLQQHADFNAEQSRNELVIDSLPGVPNSPV